MVLKNIYSGSEKMSMENKRQRRCEISFLNMLFCLIVIFIHIISYAVAELSPNTLGYNMVLFPWRFSSFVVQGFVMLSGVKLFLSEKDTMPYKKWLVLRFKSIVVPYIFCFIVYYAFYYIVFDYPLEFGFISKQFLLGNLVCHLYFIPIIVQFDLLFPIWKKIINKCSPIIVIPLCVIFSLLFENHFPAMLGVLNPDISFAYNDRLFTTYLSFYIAGCYIGKNYDSFLNILKTNFKTILGCFIITVPLYTYYTYIAYNGLASVPFINYLHFLYVWCVIMLIYSISAKFAPYLMNKIKLLKKIDAVSYDIYLWHMLVLFSTDYLLKKLGIVSAVYSFFIRTAIVYTVTIALCTIIKHLKKKLIQEALS